MVLLDTHAMLWAFADDARLSDAAKRVIAAQNAVLALKCRSMILS